MLLAGRRMYILGDTGVSKEEANGHLTIVFLSSKSHPSECTEVKVIVY